MGFIVSEPKMQRLASLEACSGSLNNTIKGIIFLSVCLLLSFIKGILLDVTFLSPLRIPKSLLSGSGWHIFDTPAKTERLRLYSQIREKQLLLPRIQQTSSIKSLGLIGLHSHP